MISIVGSMREKIDNALADGFPCYVGTASGSGKPQISMRGSVLVYDDETLAFWERWRRSTFDNVRANPQAMIFYRNTEERLHWRFHGVATVHESGDVREEVMRRTVRPEMDRDPERQGAAILVKVDEITELSGNVLQARD